MDIQKALTYPFKDKSWAAKLGLFVVVLLVPIVNLAGTGYSLEITRRVMKGNPKPLPEWEAWGRKFLDGLILALAFLVYSLPVWLLAIVPAALVAVPAFMSGNRDFQAISDIVRGAGSVLYLGLGCLSILYGLGLSLLLPAVVIRYAQEGKFAACFRLRELFAVMRRSGYFTAWIVVLGISAVAAVAGGVIGAVPILGWGLAPLIAFAATVFSLVVAAHLFGQVGAGFSARGSLKAAAISRSKGKTRAPARGKRKSAAAAPARRKPAASAKRKASSSAPARRKPTSASRTGRKPASTSRSKTKKK
jgi:hypothetical protein